MAHARQTFINLPVKDLSASTAFFTSLGFRPDPRFTGDGATCLVVGEGVFVMLLPHERFMHFSPRPVADATQVKEMLLSLSCGSREEVDDLVRKALAAGGTTHDDATDHGFMYDHGFIDLDGHAWGLFFMDPNAAPPNS